VVFKEIPWVGGFRRKILGGGIARTILGWWYQKKDHWMMVLGRRSYDGDGDPGRRSLGQSSVGLKEP